MLEIEKLLISKKVASKEASKNLVNKTRSRRDESLPL